MEIFYAGTGWLDVIDAIRARLPEHVVTRADPARPLIEQVAEAAVILPSNGRVDRAVMEAARQLRLIQQPAVGMDSIDLEAARARGVPVTHAPGTNPDSVAQAALLLILGLARKWKVAQGVFARGVIGAPLGLELTGATLGLVGRGQSAQRLVVAAEALGMVVRSVDSKSSEQELLDLLAASDVVSLHCPLTPRTRGLIGARALAVMKRGVLLVNVARGPIIERAALEEALARGQLGGVGLDVFWQEPWDPADPLWAHPDVLTLPHVGGTTWAAFGRIADIVADNVGRLERGEPLIHRVV